VEQLVDKGRFQQLAARLKLPVPPARSFRPSEESVPADLDLEFPAVLKPLTRRRDLWQPFAGQRKALRLDTADRLRALWARLAETRLPVMVQSLVPGPETRIESYHVYVDHDGHTVAEFTGRKIRTHPSIFGESSALEITDAADVARLGRDIVRRLKLRGVAKLDFKRGPEGNLFLLEVNPRFTLWHHPAAMAGVNIPALVYGDLVGRVRPPVMRARSGVRWCKLWTDWPAARHLGIPFPRWFAWALGCEAKRGIALDDPLPLIGGAFWRWRERHEAKARSSTSAAATA
jgi:predicted ATP-grasp superfamily ATP-dependent carboligase